MTYVFVAVLTVLMIKFIWDWWLDWWLERQPPIIRFRHVHRVIRVQWKIKEIVYWCKKRITDLGNLIKRLWVSSKRNPAIVILFCAWVGIALGLRAFGYDIYDLYSELHKQILEKGKTADEYRGITIRYFGIVAGAGTIIGYLIATARNIIANKQNNISEQQRITESMVQAITQIGEFNGDKPNIEVRLGGLYSLQRIMQDSPSHEEAIAKIFYAYVRENAKIDNTDPSEKNKKAKEEIQEQFEYVQGRREDVQAALDIINQFNRMWRKQGKDILFYRRINLSRTDFRLYSIQHINFNNAILEDVDLSGLNLSQQNFSNAVLERADLSYTNLCDADLSSANLCGADLRDAELYDADLSSAYLPIVENLTQRQINKAIGNYDTELPEELATPDHWEDSFKKLYDINHPDIIEEEAE